MPMPSVATSLALVLDLHHTLWDDALFQSRFGIVWNPLSDGIDTPLPRGIKTRDDCKHMATLFTSLKNLLSPQDKRSHLESRDGRTGLLIWKKWVQSSWIPKINAIVENVFHDENIHPKYLIQTDELKEFPAAQSYVHIGAAGVALTLFGDDLLTKSGYVQPSMTDIINSIAAYNWGRLRKQYARARTRYAGLRTQVEGLFECV
jgi:hypothetical protein